MSWLVQGDDPYGVPWFHPPELVAGRMIEQPPFGDPSIGSLGHPVHHVVSCHGISPFLACAAPHQLGYRDLSARDGNKVVAPVPTMSIPRSPYRMEFADECDSMVADDFLWLTALHRETGVASHVLDESGTLAALNTHSMSIGTSFLQWIAVLLSNRAGWAHGLR